VQEAIELLGNTDAILADVRLPDLEPIRDAGGTILSAEAAAYHAAWIERRPEGYGPDLRARIRSAPPPLAVPLVDALRLRMASIRRYDRLMEAFDALVGTTTPITAPPEDDLPSPSPYGRFTLPFDVTGLPALSVPCGFDRRGLPIGLMLVGRRWDERAVLRIGAAYQRATDWHRRRPALR
jgi:aspartyl-tRNA(Asn)/glutamyl-tRNA(Gln) amidotransferase subunit A